MNESSRTTDQRKTLTQLATEMAEKLGIDTGSVEIHCRDGKPKAVKVQKTINLEGT